MIESGQAGICCNNCGYEKSVSNESEKYALEAELYFFDHTGDAECPSCKHPVEFEDYI